MFNTKYDIINRAKHAIYGAFIGDAIGCTIEFTSKMEAKKIISNNSNFENGPVGLGPFNLEPGQFTDDTEMSLAILSVINESGLYDQELVAEAYHDWYLSKPFDIGNTISNAVRKSSAHEMMMAAEKYNKGSLSNGSLMRLPSIVAFYYDKSLRDLLAVIIQDTILTHSNSEVKRMALIYGIILHGAIQGKSASELYKIVKNRSSYSPLVFTIYRAVEIDATYFVYANKKYTLDDICLEYAGFMGFAFWLLLRSIKKYSSYKDAIIETISHGGDTDTNACIVGAVMGALYPNTIPDKWIDTLVSCRPKKRIIEYPITDPKIWTKWVSNLDK